MSRFAAFSFQAMKHVTTGDGGALCCAAPEDAERARVSRSFGMKRSRVTRLRDWDEELEIEGIGFMYHMNNVAAAIGLGNLSDFPRRLERRREIGARYRAELADVPGLTLPRLDDGWGHAYWFFNIAVEERDAFAVAMGNRGVPVSVVNSRIDAHPVFGGMRGGLPGMSWFNTHQIALPVHDALTDANVERIVAAVKTGWLTHDARYNLGRRPIGHRDRNSDGRPVKLLPERLASGRSNRPLTTLCGVSGAACWRAGGVIPDHVIT